MVKICALLAVGTMLKQPEEEPQCLKGLTTIYDKSFKGLATHYHNVTAIQVLLSPPLRTFVAVIYTTIEHRIESLSVLPSVFAFCCLSLLFPEVTGAAATAEVTVRP